MASERFFGQALLESDYVNPNFFYLLAKEDKKALRSCRVHIPPTALFEQGFAKALFSTEYIKGHPSSGEVKRKVGRDVDSQDVFDVMTKGISDEHAVCAVLVFAAPRAVELTNVRFMDKEEVRRFLFHELEKPKCLMQRFIQPQGNNNSVILASWSPLLVLTEGRRSMNSLLDRHMSPNARGLTFEDPTVPTLEVAISESTIKDITQVCARIAEHFDRTERLRLNRITAFFKVDASNTLTLLYTTSLRFHDQVVGQPPVSLATHVHVADLQQKSLTQRFQGLGSKVRRDTQDALEWMDVALQAADEKNAKMEISIPTTGNMGAMIFEESRRTASRLGTNIEKSISSPMRSVSRVGSLAQPQSVGAGTNASRNGSLRSSTRIDGQPDVASSAASRVGGASKAALMLDPSSPPRPDQVKPSASFEGQYLTIAPNAPLPQPRQLLKFQHVLPNSVNNMSSQVQLHALGLNEEAIRTEWDNFLTQQLRDIKRIRIAQASSSSAVVAGGSAQDGAGVEGGDGSASGGMRDGGTLAPPPPKLHATFGKHHDRETGTPATRVLGEEKDPDKLQAASQASLKAAQDKAAQREKDTYMEEMRDEVARRALGKTKSSLSGDGDGKGKRGDGSTAIEEPVVELEDDPRFYYVPREGRNLLQLPDGVGAHRGTLLPPVFSVPSSFGNNSVGNNATTRGAAVSKLPKKKGPAKPSKNTPVDSNTSVLTKCGGASSPTKAPLLTKNPSSTFDQAAPASRAAGTSETPSPASSPTSKGEKASQKALSSSLKQQSGNSLGRSGTSDRPSAPPSPLSPRAANAQSGASRFRKDDCVVVEVRTARNYVEEALSAYARVPKMYSDFDALHDAPEEIFVIKTRAKDLCDSFSTFVQELHYSIHGAFLNRAIPSSFAYAEIPPSLRPIVDIPTLARMLHKLHPKVLPREEFLCYNSQSPLFALHTHKVVAGSSEEEAVLRWREQLLEALRSVSLTEFSFERLSSWSELQPLTRNTTTPPTLNEDEAHSGGAHAQKGTQLDPARDLCLIVPLVDGDKGLKILRSESFSIANDVSHYVNERDGIIFHRALQHCYYARIVEIKGEQAALEEKQLQEEEARRAALLEATTSSLSKKAQLPLDGDDDEGSLPSPVRGGDAAGGGGSNRSTSPPFGSRRKLSGGMPSVKSSLQGVSDLGEVENSIGAFDGANTQQQNALLSKVDDMMCKRCHTCRVCCVCSLVSSPSASPTKRLRK